MLLRHGASKTRASQQITAAAKAFSHQVWTEPFRSFPSLAWPWTLILGLVCAGGVLLRWHPPSAVVLALLGAVCFVGQALGWIQVGWLFAGRQSENVVAVVPSLDTVMHRVLLVVDYDRPDRLPSVRGGPWVGQSWGLTLVLAIMALGLAPVAVLHLFYPRPLLVWLALAPVSVSILGVCLVWSRELSGQLGRESTALGPEVTVAMSTGKTVADQPLAHTEVWLVFTGCGHLGHVGLRAFLDRHRRLLEGADFLLVGGWGVQRFPALMMLRGCPALTLHRLGGSVEAPCLTGDTGSAQLSQQLYQLAVRADSQFRGSPS